MAPLKVLVIGGGIGGPAVAAGLARNGHDVTLYESSNKTSEVGYAFRVTPNADRCLKHLDIDTISGGAVAANCTRIMAAKGDVIRETKENLNADHRKTGTSVFTLRSQLNQQLMSAATNYGAKVVTGKTVTKVDVESTTIEVEKGETIHGDLIIAADGCGSSVRPLIVDEEKFHPKAYTGNDCFRFMVDKSSCRKDELLSTLVDDNVHFMSWVAPGKRILVYPVDFDRQFNVTLTHPQELTEGASQTASIEYNHKASLSNAQAIYSDFEPRARRLLELADAGGLRVWNLVDMEDIPSWSKHRTALLGDAAHAVEPFGFSGASMAIEDAMTLSTLFGDDVSKDDLGAVQKRLALYEKIRRPRVKRVRDTSRFIGNGGDQEVDKMKDYMAFLSEYDVAKHTEEIMAAEM